MVVRISLTLLIVWLPLHLFSQDVKVTAQMERGSIAGTPLEGTITVTHSQSQPVNIESFRLGGERMTVEFVREVQLSQFSDIVLSIYRFFLEPKEAGLHELPEIIVTVGNRNYRSVPSAYSVQEATPAAVPSRPTPGPQPQAATTRMTIILKLENIVEGGTTLHPGQQLVVGYRFLYNFSVDLTREELPLLEANGFQKVGGKTIKEFKVGQLNHLEARQVIEAVKPGEFHFPAGVIKGRAYQTDSSGQKQIAPVDSLAESGPVTLHVIPFPAQDKPPSFNGAIGTSLEFEVELLSPDALAVGDKLTLLIKISGSGQLATIPVPEVCCQPGFSGFFRVSDLPPVEEIVGTAKTFKVEMRPLSDTLTEIPPLEFSYFNPETKTYTTLKSKPIPIAVTPLKGEPLETAKPRVDEKLPQGKPESAAPSPQAIEIEGNDLLSPADLKPNLFGTWWTLLIIPFGVVAIFLQWQMKRFIETQRAIVKPKTSQALFNEAMQQKPGTSAFFHRIQKAFLLRLVERGEIESDALSSDDLPAEGAPGKVRCLLREIEEKRFAGAKEEFNQEFIAKIKRVFHDIAPG